MKIIEEKKQSILVYAGPGVSEKSLEQTLKSLHNIINGYEITTIMPPQLIQDDWETKTALLIIPGGADIPYTKSLNGTANQKIKAYVAKGGAYFGLCAGSYYAGQAVEFASGTALEVIGKRELAFFQGVVRGPILAEYDYKTSRGARAATIRWQDKNHFKQGTNFLVFYNGGGYFVDTSNDKNSTILATYDKGEPAIIECHVGKGKAILSGVHVEYDPELLDASDCDLQPLIPKLRHGNQDRMQLLIYLLKRLNINF